ncbi:MAG TPA: metallophosphoesterase [Humisphaera sp.]
MPITLPPISRRRFLASSLGAAAAAVLGRRPALGADAAAAPRPVDPHRFLLFSDPHLAADPKAVHRGVAVLDAFERARADALAFGETRAAGAIVCGDLAFRNGQPGDYATFLAAARPIREAGIPVHLALGNHDDRANFFAAVPAGDRGAAAGAANAVEGRQVTVVETPRADWLILDSLEVTQKSPGMVGPEQRKWLAGALDARRDKPCVVVVHHNPQPAVLPIFTGLRDTAELLAVLLPRRQAKALVFGHTHQWEHHQMEGLHLVNLPTTGFPFAAGIATGWVDCALAAGRARLTLRTIDPKHPQQNEVRELAWRA